MNRKMITVQESLAKLVDRAPNCTSRINEIGDRFLAITKKETIDLTNQEKEILTALFKDKIIDVLTIDYLHHELEQFKNGGPINLYNKLKNATFAQKVAIVEMLR
jgi:hypothetical protein